jgi:hypothetical protein
LGPLGTSAIYWPMVPAPAPLCPPQIPLDQTRDSTRAAAVGSQRLTASAMARPYRDSNSEPSVVHPIASRYTDYAILYTRTYSNCVGYIFAETSVVPAVMVNAVRGLSEDFAGNLRLDKFRTSLRSSAACTTILYVGVTVMASSDH